MRMKSFRKFTSAVPIKEKTVVAMVPGALSATAGFANTVEEKIAMAKERGDSRVYIAWPGKYETHIFKTTGKELLAAMEPKPAFKVGDLVRVTSVYGAGPAVDTVGVVRAVNSDTGKVGVEFSGFKRGHSLSNLLAGTKRSGYWVPAGTIEAA